MLIPVEATKPILADALCRILPDPEHVAKRLSSLSPEQRAMVQTLAAEGGELLEAEAVEKFANGFLPRLQAQLSDLTGLVFRDAHTLGDPDVLIGIPESLLKSIPIPDADQGRLLVILKPYLWVCSELLQIRLACAFQTRANSSYPTP